jgi:hypothetical protein
MHKFKIASTFYAVSHVVGVKCRNHFELVHFIYPCRPRRAPPPPPPPTPRAAPAPLAAPAAPTAIMNQYYLYIYLFKIISSFLFFYSFFVFHVAWSANLTKKKHFLGHNRLSCRHNIPRNMFFLRKTFFSMLPSQNDQNELIFVLQWGFQFIYKMY